MSVRFVGKKHLIPDHIKKVSLKMKTKIGLDKNPLKHLNAGTGLRFYCNKDKMKRLNFAAGSSLFCRSGLGR